MTWPRPIPLIGDATSAAEREAAPDGWALPQAVRDALHEVIAVRRDVRRFRPEPVPEQALERVLGAAHRAPSVGQSQPWRFVVVTDPQTRTRAAALADRERLRQAAQLEPDAGRRLLDLQLEGIREAPLGVVVACDRRVPAAGVLGRATFPDADLWSCACAIQNLWLAARAEGLGVGWVTLFQPADLAELLCLPHGVVTLGWLCLGWPDERPPEPGLERAGWSRRQPLSEVVLRERWPADGEQPPLPVSRLAPPTQRAVVEARDVGDQILAVPGSLGVLDRAVDRALAVGLQADTGGVLVLAVGRHPVTRHGVSAFDPSVAEDVLRASRAGVSQAAVAARSAGLTLEVLDGGTSCGDLVNADALTPQELTRLIELGRRAAPAGALVALGEVGIGNTTVAAALTAAALGLPAEQVVGLGTGADSAMLERKTAVVRAALARARAQHGAALDEPHTVLAALGGPELAVLVGVVLGAAERGSLVVLDGLATSVSALLAVRIAPAAGQFLVAGQRSRERAHATLLTELGQEPLLDLRLRAGEGVGAALAAGLLRQGLSLRHETARTRGR